MTEFYTDAMPGPVLTTVAELEALPAASIVTTADGFRYVKTEERGWYMQYAKNTPPSWLLDPEHSAQPIRLLFKAAS